MNSQVTTAMKYGDDRLPRPWSKYSEGSSGYTSSRPPGGATSDAFPGASASAIGKAALVATGEADASGAKRAKRERLQQASERVAKEQKLLEDLYKVEADRSLDPELHEFMEVMGSRKGRQGRV